MLLVCKNLAFNRMQLVDHDVLRACAGSLAVSCSRHGALLRVHKGGRHMLAGFMTYNLRSMTVLAAHTSSPLQKHRDGLRDSPKDVFYLHGL